MGDRTVSFNHTGGGGGPHHTGGGGGGPPSTHPSRVQDKRPPGLPRRTCNTHSFRPGRHNASKGSQAREAIFASVRDPPPAGRDIPEIEVIRERFGFTDVGIAVHAQDPSAKIGVMVAANSGRPGGGGN